jgi:hypothetical protein
LSESEHRGRRRVPPEPRSPPAGPLKILLPWGGAVNHFRAAFCQRTGVRVRGPLPVVETPMLAQTTQPAFTLDGVTAFIIAVTGLLLALPAVLVAAVAFYRSMRAEVAAAAAQGSANAAQASSDQNSQRITNTSAHVARVDGQQTELAQKVGEVAGAATAAATALLAQQQPKPPWEPTTTWPGGKQQP